MKLKVMLVLLLSTVTVSGYAQKSKFQKYANDKNYQSGQIQMKNGVMLNGLLRMRSEISMHTKITFVDSVGNKSNYKPTDLKGYEIDGINFRSDGEAHFYRQVSKGLRLSLYQRRYKPTYSKDYGVQRDFTSSAYKLTEGESFEDLGVFRFFIKESESAFFQIPQEGGFHDAVAEYLRDCPQLARNIKEKKFKESDVQRIMDVYNFRCEF